jgi:hypothetical protein
VGALQWDPRDEAQIVAIFIEHAYFKLKVPHGCPQEKNFAVQAQHAPQP